jgi:hypothetical protein
MTALTLTFEESWEPMMKIFDEEEAATNTEFNYLALITLHADRAPDTNEQMDTDEYDKWMRDRKDPHRFTK